MEQVQITCCVCICSRHVTKAMQARTSKAALARAGMEKCKQNTELQALKGFMAKRQTCIACPVDTITYVFGISGNLCRVLIGRLTHTSCKWDGS